MTVALRPLTVALSEETSCVSLTASVGSGWAVPATNPGVISFSATGSLIVKTGRPWQGSAVSGIVCTGSPAPPVGTGVRRKRQTALRTSVDFTASRAA
ncbi:hypothetical protein WKI68_06895 [Streptomyces sp. MS1.HAVA.3]|uniref:Uncharacterized protein n=1 Tax=Streptomyces caledonius TaxID=3134107 RepID=A0ABU8U0A6_9ACTN